MLTHTNFHNKNCLDVNIVQCVQWKQSDPDQAHPG